ncbi:MAG: YqjD family protein [Parvibaculaceae bacterium]
MSNAQATAKKAVDPSDGERLAEQIDQIRNELVVLTNLIGDIASERGIELKDRAEALADRAQNAGKQLFRDAKGQAGALEDELTRQLRERPLTSIAVAAVMGYFFGLMSRR